MSFIPILFIRFGMPLFERRLFGRLFRVFLGRRFIFRHAELFRAEDGKVIPSGGYYLRLGWIGIAWTK